MSNGRLAVLILTLIAIVFGTNFYIERRLFQWILYIFPYISRPVFAGLYIMVVLTIIVGRFPFLSNKIRKPIAWIGAHWLGISIYLLLFFLLADLVLLIGALYPVQFYVSTAAIILTIAVSGYGFYNAARIKHVSYSIKLKRSLPGEMNIVFISDLHLGDINSEKRLGYIVNRINSLKPDIVAMVGDVFHDDFTAVRNPEKASAHFRNIRATYGVFAVLGNHDAGHTLPQMIELLERSNVKLLNDEHVTIDDKLILLGRTDASPLGGFGGISRKPHAEVMAKVNTLLPVVVLEHNPARMAEYGSEVDLILSGHTHRGQLFPGSLITKWMYTVDYGHYHRASDGVQVVVSQGVHTWMMPMRVGTFNEIVSVVAT